ncbi:hypothetical protein PYCC9005_005967 [Savitreella phatthalungensis]
MSLSALQKSAPIDEADDVSSDLTSLGDMESLASLSPIVERKAMVSDVEDATLTRPVSSPVPDFLGYTTPPRKSAASVVVQSRVSTQSASPTTPRKRKRSSGKSAKRSLPAEMSGPPTKTISERPKKRPASTHSQRGGFGSASRPITVEDSCMDELTLDHIQEPVFAVSGSSATESIAHSTESSGSGHCSPQSSFTESVKAVDPETSGPASSSSVPATIEQIGDARPLARGFVKLRKPVIRGKTRRRTECALHRCDMSKEELTSPESFLQNGTCKTRQMQHILQDICRACRTRASGDCSCRAVGLRRFLPSSSSRSRPTTASTITSATDQDSPLTEAQTEAVSEDWQNVARRYVLDHGKTHQAFFNSAPPATTILPSDLLLSLQLMAPNISTLMAAEAAHAKNPQTLYRPREPRLRPMCDACATTIFSGHWVCYCCFREFCLDCIKEWDDSALTTENYHVGLCVSESTGAAGALRPTAHTKALLVPYTRTTSAEFADVDLQLALLQELVPSMVEPILENASRDPIEDVTMDPLSAKFARSHIDRMDDAAFERHWRTGEPLLLQGFAGRFALDWTPEGFTREFGDQETELVNVVARTVWVSTIGSFFRALEHPNTAATDTADDPTRHLKLNDWPDVEDFAEAMPSRFTDFDSALPFPQYTRRKGAMNLATYFPPDLLPPDLGPKLYCAGASSDAPGHQGTTVLHMDMTDAVNIMTWSSHDPLTSTRPGAAVWDIFPHDALPFLRRYMLLHVVDRNDASQALMDDPIRRARYYLTTADLAALSLPENGGVKPWRIYQNVGEAVFIPAGCAHQVCNLAGCIKVACDFVSPHHALRSHTILHADRKLAPLAPREDVLQLKNILFFAWRAAFCFIAPSPTPPITSTTSSTANPPSVRRSTRTDTAGSSASRGDVSRDAEMLKDAGRNRSTLMPAPQTLVGRLAVSEEVGVTREEQVRKALVNLKTAVMDNARIAVHGRTPS